MIRTKNPQAFPQNTPRYEGMTLLDWFAGQSLKGTKANHQLLKILQDTDNRPIQEIIADMAYTDAEAMLKEREKRNEN